MTDNLLQRKQWQSITTWENTAAQKISNIPTKQVDTTAKSSPNVPEKVLVTRRWSPCHIPQKELSFIVLLCFNEERHTCWLTDAIYFDCAGKRGKALFVRSFFCLSFAVNSAVHGVRYV